VKYLSGAPIQSRPLALPTNMILGLKGLPGTNTLDIGDDISLKISNVKLTSMTFAI
jgi:hypothetical protein